MRRVDISARQSAGRGIAAATELALRHLAKVGVAGSNPVVRSRSESVPDPGGEVSLVARTRLSASRKRGLDMSERGPEVQFQLANERTYLAWLRTALALVASGVAAARLLAGQTLHWAWETVGVLLIMAGVVTAAMARRRWRATDAAIREGEPLPAPGIAVMIAGVIVVCGLITTALLLGTNPGRVP
jgi:putative membrane protein